MSSIEPTRTSTGAERRRHTRLRVEWPVTVELDDGPHQARIRDISRGGVSFFLDRPVEEMTILEVAFELPGDGGDRNVAGQGAVVRCERISAALDHYEIALFLTEMPDAHREAIEEYVRASQSAPA